MTDLANNRPVAVQQSKTVANIENAIFIVATFAFFALSLGFLLTALVARGELKPNLLVALVAFAMALICFFVSPMNQSRTLKLLMEKLAEMKEMDAGDIAILQKSVGSAGYFNRIGLTGIPLAVALLALAFCGMTFLAHQWKTDSLQTHFMDLTKLTVGAFIGALTKARTGQKGNNKGDE